MRQAPLVACCFALLVNGKNQLSNSLDDNEAQPRWSSEGLPSSTTLTEAVSASLLENMTIQNALSHLPPASSELTTFLHRHLGISEGGSNNSSSSISTKANSSRRPGESFLQARTSRTEVAAAAALGAARELSTSGNVETARQKLNEMLFSSYQKLETEKQRCDEEIDKHEQVAADARQVFDDYSAQTAAARTRMLMARSAMTAADEGIPKLEEALNLHRSKCESDRNTFQTQIMAIQKDATTIQSVLGNSSCNPGLLQLACHRHPIRGTFVTFRHPALRCKISELQTAAVRRTVQRTLSGAAGMMRSNRHGHRRTSHGHQTRVHQRIRRHHIKSIPQTRAHVKMPHHHRVALLTESRVHHRHRQRQLQPDAERALKAHQKHNCAMPASTPTCDTLQPRFLSMQADVEDKIESLKEDFAAANEACKSAEDNLQAQMQELSYKSRSAQSQLADATDEKIQAQEQSRLKGIQVDSIAKDGKRLHESCEDNLRSIASEICGARKIRGELDKMNSEQAFIQDCQVSDWIPDECSASCDGGEQTLRRTVITPAVKGAACPALTTTRKCNEAPCPIDCVLDEWSGWSSCSSLTECVPGVKERYRRIAQHPEHRGTPCAPAVQQVQCNAGTCDANCALGAWSSWSKCNKACDGGFSMRARHVTKESTGDGKCPAEDSAARLQFHSCGNSKCAPKTDGKLKCMSKLDVVLLLDGSGGISDAGWTAIKTAGAALVNAFSTGADGAQLATLLFSGPKDLATYHACKNGSANLDTKCKITWVEHFTSDASALAGKIQALTQPKGSTYTSMALATAATEMISGRSSAGSLLLTITASKSLDKQKTTRVAKRLMKRYRLLWVPVTHAVPISTVKELASMPKRNNVLAVNTFADLTAQDTINKIIANACPTVE
jgi:hypothetical protein